MNEASLDFNNELEAEDSWRKMDKFKLKPIMIALRLFFYLTLPQCYSAKLDK